MAYDPAQAGRVGITPARMALLRVYATLDRMPPPPGSQDASRVPLDEAIRNVLQIDFPAGEDLPTAVDALAAAVGEERTDEPGSGGDGQGATPKLPMVRVAEAVMDAIPAAKGTEAEAPLRAVTKLLLRTSERDDEGHVSDLASDLESLPLIADAAGSRDWRPVTKDGLHPDLVPIRASGCKGSVHKYGGEFPTQLDTYFEVARDVGGTAFSFDELAWSCLPLNWPHCNDFFCLLRYCPERQHDYPGSTADQPTSKAAYWRGVFEERVMTCPQGAFPTRSWASRGSGGVIARWCCGTS